jgi:2'-5' RNA ligase
MSFLGIRVPNEITRLLSAIEIPGDKVPREEMHVTLIYVGKETPLEHLVKVIMAVYPVVSETTPFIASTRRVTCFPGGDDGVPIIAPIESEPLHELHAALCAALDEAGVEYNKKWPTFKPHCTLGYSPDAAVYSEMAADQDIVPAVQWGVGEIVLWGGDAGDDKLTVTFPFRLMPRPGSELEDKRMAVEASRRAAYQGVVKLASAMKEPRMAHNPDGTCPQECPCHKEPLVHKVAERFKAACGCNQVYTEKEEVPGYGNLGYGFFPPGTPSEDIASFLSSMFRKPQ